LITITQNKEHLFLSYCQSQVKQNTDSYLKSLIDFKRDIGVKIFLILDRANMA